MEIMQYGKTYSEYKKELDTEMEKAAEGFVRIGYLLKVARDTDILAESGYQTVAEFAQAEYGIDKTQTSRFMRINDRFSEGGYSDRLLPAYRGFGHAKLTLMLSMPDEINAELTADYTKSEIQDIKEAVDAEKKDTEIELMLEERQQVQAEGIPEDLAEFAYNICRENTGLYTDLWECIHGNGHLSVTEILVPDGQQTYIARIPGKGRFTLFLQPDGRDAAFCSIRNPQDKQFFPAGLVEKAFLSTVPEAENVRKAYEKFYGIPWPEELKDTPEKKTEKKTRVVKTEPVKKKTEPEVAEKAEPEKEKAEPEKEKAENPGTERTVPEEQIPGQMDVYNYPEAVPEKIPEEETEVLPPETEIQGQTQGSSPVEETEKESGMEKDAGNTPKMEKTNRAHALSYLGNASDYLKTWRHADTMPHSVLSRAVEQTEAALRILKELQEWKGGENGTE